MKPSLTIVYCIEGANGTGWTQEVDTPAPGWRVAGLGERLAHQRLGEPGPTIYEVVEVIWETASVYHAAVVVWLKKVSA